MKKILVNCTCSNSEPFARRQIVKAGLRISLEKNPYASEPEQHQSEYHMASCHNCCQSAVSDDNLPRQKYCPKLHMLVNYLLEYGEMPPDLLAEYGGQQESGFDPEELLEFEAHKKICKVCQKYEAIIKNGWKEPKGKEEPNQKQCGPPVAANG